MLDKNPQTIGNHERVAIVTTRKDVGVRTVPVGIYLHLLSLPYQIPEGVKYFCTDIQGRFQAWPIAARITIKGLQHRIPSTGDWFLDVEIAVALKKLSGQMLDSGKSRAPFEEHWQAPAELILLKDPDKPLVDVDFKLGWAPGGGRLLGSCDFGDLRALTQSGRKLKDYKADLPGWVGAKKQR